MSAPTKLSQQLSKVASTWHVDPFRPHMQLKTFMEHMSTHPNLTAKAVRAARDLHDNALFNKYPLQKRTIEPASRPLHYSRLREAFEKSAQGIGRPWWKIFFGIW